MKRLILALPLLLAAGCGTVKPPEVPEFHPASPHAPQALRIEAFDVLTPVPTPPPSLPVPEGMQQPPPKMDMGGEGMGKMPGDSMDNMGKGEVSHEHGHAEHEAPAPSPELHGPAPREGMMQGMPEGTPQPQYSQDHARPSDTLYQERIDDDIKRGEAKMDPVKIPSEQRGMHVDSSHYHQHKHHDSTHIVHPERDDERSHKTDRHIWACPMHPDYTLDTPGGRCPQCGAILVPIPEGSE
jgi:hypothetical protein